MSYLIIIAGWALLVGGARKSLTMITHYCIHNQFSGNKLIDRIVGEFLTTILFLQNFDAYKKDHCFLHHNSKTFATSLDPDAAFLIYLGFEPGKTKGELWKVLWLTLVSPKFHGAFLYARFKANFVTAPFYRVFMSVIWVAMICVVGTINNVWLIIFIAYIIPMTVFYHISALIQFLSEHNWLVKKCLDEPASTAHYRLSWARFLGEEIPHEHLPLFSKAIAWIRWFLWMFFLYPMVRIIVFPGDLSQHDLHHYKSSCDWPNAPYVRQKEVEAGEHKVPYQEIWGVFNAIDTVLDGLSKTKALTSTTQTTFTLTIN